MAIWSTEIKELENLYKSLKGHLPELEKELERLIKADDDNMILLYSRRCLEVIITDLCECELKRDRGTEPLKGIIDKLNKEKKIPPHIIASMHGLIELSSYGAHPKDFDPEQVKPVLNNLNIIIKWYLKYKNFKGAVKGTTEQRNQLEEVKKEERTELQETPAKKSKRELLSGGIVTGIFLVVVVILAYPKIYKRDRLEDLRLKGERISVAVMPFQNMTNDTSLNIWQDGIQNILITSLSNSDKLTVRPVESVKGLIQSKGLTNYASLTPSIASRISQKLDAKLFVYGSMHQSGNSLRLNVQLIDARTNELFNSFHTDTPIRNGIDFTMLDSISTGIKNFLIISNLIEEHRDFSRDIRTNSPEAYKFFMLGLNVEDQETKLEWFRKALDIDSNFINAESYISSIYLNMGMFEQGRDWFHRVYRKKDKMTPKLQIWMERKYAQFYGTPYDEINQMLKLKQIDDQDYDVYYNLGVTYHNVYQYEKAITELEKAMDIRNNWHLKPSKSLYFWLGSAYQNTGQYKKTRNIYEKGLQDFPDYLYLINRLAVIALAEGHTGKANRYFEKWISKLETALNEAEINNAWARLYSEAGILDKAEECYLKALSIQPDNNDNKYLLAKFLIDKNRDVNQGMDLIGELIKSYPERYQTNYEVLDSYGWGLYKQGKYREALDTLQKSWDLRRQEAIYNHEAFLHLEAAKKAVAGLKQ